MDRNNQKKYDQLGMPVGTANNILRKSIIFYLAKQCNLDICYRCNQKIENVDELSVEHKIPWLDSDNPVKLFFDLDNIAFSHLICNVDARRKTYSTSHGSYGYQRGCRCEICKSTKSSINERFRSKK